MIMCLYCLMPLSVFRTRPPVDTRDNMFVGPGTGLTLMARTDPVMREIRARDPLPGTIDRNMCGEIIRIY